ncbi:MAG: hypothetical protein ACOYMG_13000 [Candidatus Methylumidiphilus sp.]
MTTTTKAPAKTPRKRAQKSAAAIQATPADSGLTALPEEGAEQMAGLDAPADHAGESASAGQSSSQAMACVANDDAPIDEDEAVVQRVEHLNRSVGWLLISAGIVGLVVPGVLGTPFLIMGGLALWPGNHQRVERWRQGHSPKMFHGAMKQINRFLDDLDRRYPPIDKR